MDFNTAKSITLTSTDADGDAQTYSIIPGSGPLHGTLGAISGANVTYTPTIGYSGPDSFQFKANDGHADSATATFTITVSPAPGNLDGMVLIPAGSFEMGDHHDSMPGALPVHTVSLNAYYIGRYEVTNREYSDALNWANAQGLVEVRSGGLVYQPVTGGVFYCDTTTSSSDSRITWNGSTFSVTAGKEDHPMVMVSWYGSVAYCNWRSEMTRRQVCYDTTTWVCDFTKSGYRLPTEVEWEKAARGGQYDPYRRYPWGDTINGSMANYWQSGDPFETVFPWTTPVAYYNGGQTPSGVDMANGYGLYDMAGNVWEWCNDWYGIDYYSVSPANDPPGPSTGTDRVLRGGSWVWYVDFDLRCAVRFRFGPDGRGADSGFRVAAGTNSQPPVANPQSVTVLFNTPTPITLTGSDADDGPQPLTFSIVTHPEHGPPLTGTPPNVTYTSTSDYSGPDHFTFTVNDGAAESEPAMVAVEVRAAPPPNDACPDATAVAIPSSTEGDTSTATPDTEYPFCGTSISTNGLWYRLIGSGNSITATTCNAVSAYDNKLSAFCGGCDRGICIAGNDDSCFSSASGLNSTIAWCSEAGVEYLILVHGFGSATGAFQLDVSDNGQACGNPALCLP